MDAESPAGRGAVVRSKDVGAAAAVLLPFTAALAVLVAARAPRPGQLRQADAIVQAFYDWIGRGAVPVLAAAICVAVLVVCRPDRAALGRALRLAVMGCAAAAALLIAMAVVYGDRMPSFVPPEESAKPGLALGFAAGIAEEAIFRLLVAPATYFVLAPVAGRRAAVVAAVVATGLLFALAHEVGPGAGGFDAAHFVTRLVLPGSLMTVLFFRVGPSFIVAAHPAAHLVIPLLFK